MTSGVKNPRKWFFPLQGWRWFASSRRPQAALVPIGFGLIVNRRASCFPAPHRPCHGKHFSPLVQPASNLLPLKIAVCAGSAAAGVALAFAYYATPKAQVVGYQPSQPIPFSHKIHVDQLGLDCRYCHSFVDVAGHSNVPTGNTCWNCHQHVQRESPKLPVMTASRSSGCASTSRRITSTSTTRRT